MKKKFVIVLFALACCVVCIFGCAACNNRDNDSSIDGTYYLYAGGSLDKSQYITLEGTTWKNDTANSGEAEISGENITLYTEVFEKKEKFANGTVKNGILTLNIFGYEFCYCKEGKNPSSDLPGGNDTPSVTYTVIFDANGGRFTDGETAFTAKLKENSLLVAPLPPTKNGFTLEGWSTDKNSSTVWNFDTDLVTKDITLYAIWAEQSAEILSIDGATIEGTDIDMFVESNTESVSLSQKVVCNFGSTWKLYKDKLGQKEIPTKIATGESGKLSDGENIFYIVVNSSDASKSTTYTLTVYRSYAVSVLFYDGNELLKTQTAYTGKSFKANYTPIIDGYTFEGWKTSGGKSFAVGILWENLSLYASKKANTYTVTYDVKGGNELSNSNQIVTYGAKYKLSVPVRTGYTFVGWYAKNEQLTDEIGNSLAVWSYSENLVVEAKWEIKQYMVTAYVSPSGAGTITGTGAYNYNSRVTLTAKTNNGYTWVGWYKDGEQVSSAFSYTFTLGAANEYFTPRWIVCPVTLETNYSNAGAVSGTEKTVLGENTTITAETNPGYTFVGWFNGDTKLTDQLKYSFIMPAENITYTAKWCKVTIDCGDSDAGSVSSLTETYKTGDEVSITAETNPGYTFVGWFNGDTKLTDQLKYSFIMPAEDITYTAKWKISDEMLNFKFTSTETTCEITSIIDKAVTEIIVPNYVTLICESAFSECSSLKQIVLPFVGGSVKTATETYQYPFGYIFGRFGYTGGTATSQYYYGPNTNELVSNSYYIPSTLRSVTITGGNILSGAFYGCWGLTDITLPNDITAIGGMAFCDCVNLKAITLPNSIISIGNGAFSGCESLSGIEIPASVTSIGSQTFRDCYAITSLTIPYGVTSIGSSAFDGCVKLTNITLPDSITVIGNMAFANCLELKSIRLPNGLTSISSYLFDGDRYLTSIVIPSSIKTVQINAFEDCYYLGSVYYSGTAEDWASISIASGNEYFSWTATRYYYSKNNPFEDGTVTEGNYWYYGESGEIIHWKHDNEED